MDGACSPCAGLLDEKRMRESDVDGYYREALANPNSFVLVAVENDVLAGFIKGDITPIADFFKYYDRTMILDDVYVFPQFRRQGVARLLFQSIELKAKEQGIRRLQGRVYSYNDPIMRLLESEGYTKPFATWDKLI